MPRQVNVKRSEVVPISKLQQQEIDAMKQRLATAKIQASAASKSLVQSKETKDYAEVNMNIAKKMLDSANKDVLLSQNQYDISHKELQDAEKCLADAQASLQADADVQKNLQSNEDSNKKREAPTAAADSKQEDSNKKRKAAEITSNETSPMNQTEKLVGGSDNNMAQDNELSTSQSISNEDSNKKREAPAVPAAADSKQEDSHKERKATVTTSINFPVSRKTPTMSKQTHDMYLAMVNAEKGILQSTPPSPPADWTCSCGKVVPGKKKRCSECNKWRGGKRAPYETKVKERLPTTIKTDTNIDEEHWICPNCQNEVSNTKSRCGKCHRWRGGKRKGGWKIKVSEVDESGIEWDKDWTCCEVMISAAKKRCGKCNGWRGGKRVASKKQKHNVVVVQSPTIKRPRSKDGIAAAVAYQQSLNSEYETSVKETQEDVDDE